MTKGIVATSMLVLALGAPAPQAYSAVAEGQPAPAFTKNQLDSPGPNQTTPRSLSDYAGKVVFLFMLGHNGPVCLADGPSIEAS